MTAKPDLKVVSLHDSNFRDVVTTLRKVADEIEAGDYGEVGCLALVLLGDQMHVFGMGPDSDGPSVGILLHAGVNHISRNIEFHGRE